MIRMLLLVGAGSFVGGVARYLLSRAVQAWFAVPFPVGTMVVNVVGCLAVGVIYGLSEHGGIMDGELRTALAVGFCGGFTTFSTFMHENLMLLEGGRLWGFAGYSLLSFGLGLAAVCFGHLIAKTIMT